MMRGLSEVLRGFRMTDLLARPRRVSVDAFYLHGYAQSDARDRVRRSWFASARGNASDSRAGTGAAAFARTCVRSVPHRPASAGRRGEGVFAAAYSRPSDRGDG